MSLELDFLAQKGAIAEIIEKAGHKCIFYPKFHCELNFIERYWGAAKNYARKNCDYSWAGLKKISVGNGYIHWSAMDNGHFSIVSIELSIVHCDLM